MKILETKEVKLKKQITEIRASLGELASKLLAATSAEGIEAVVVERNKLLEREKKAVEEIDWVRKGIVAMRQQDSRNKDEDERKRKQALVDSVLANPPKCDVCGKDMVPRVNIPVPYFSRGSWETLCDWRYWRVEFTCYGPDIRCRTIVSVYPDEPVEE